ncbi:MCE family protein [Pseudonocardia sp. NPDC049154]|uniref:MCE family protein n=1 Tax=Pseudonocardia sp. NPDC049154 TaxID=3155501 RepID=UPI0033CFF637
MIWQKMRLEMLGLIGVVVAVLTVAAVLAAYLKVFDPGVEVTVKADRAGLLLSPESDVSLRSVQIGKVTKVSPDGDDGALIDVRIDSDQLDRLPANVTAQLVAPTVFGPKYVDLLIPEQPTQRRLAAGETVNKAVTQIEVNTVFDSLMSVLTTVQPAKLNAGLGALSTSLQGKGDDIGEYLVELNRYLDAFNPALPTVQRDLELLGQESDVLAGLSPDLVGLLQTFPTTADTLTEKSAAFDAFMVSLSGLADDANGFLDVNDRPLRESLDVLRPTTALAARYSTMFPCLFHSFNSLRKITEPSFGGNQPGLRTFTSFGPGQRGYRYPDNLLTLGVDQPGCNPEFPSGTEAPRHVPHDDGAPPLMTRDEPLEVGNPPLAVLLFGEAGKEAGR